MRARFVASVEEHRVCSTSNNKISTLQQAELCTRTRSPLLCAKSLCWLSTENPVRSSMSNISFPSLKNPGKLCTYRGLHSIVELQVVAEAAEVVVCHSSCRFQSATSVRPSAHVYVLRCVHLDPWCPATLHLLGASLTALLVTPDRCHSYSTLLFYWYPAHCSF